VEPAVAWQMAQGVRTLLGVDVGVSTTGVAGPDPQDGQPVGTVHIAVVTPDGTGITSLEIPGTREQIRATTVDRALALCLEEL
jgi:nicotinamide-nucleotide amidase